MSSCALQIADFTSSIAILILFVNSLTISRSEWFCVKQERRLLGSGVDVIVVLELCHG